GKGVGIMYEIRVIENESYLEDSQRLLYRVYVEEQGWWFSKNNPAGLRVKDGRLIDNRSYIATVFEAVQEQQSPHEVRARRDELLHQQQYVHYEPHDKEYANILIVATMIQMCTAIDKLDRLITAIDKLDRFIDKGESSMSSASS
ncbi:12539_t:CDS:2, partial [Cetraspora pellucida]